MNVSFERWKNRDAVQCITGENALTIGIATGPRILSFTHNGGENILYEDHTGFSVGAWYMYGGHRFTTAPENEESYYPDNDPCEVKLEGSSVRISAKQRPNGLALSLVINESSQGGFYIDHVLLNTGVTEWEGALWAITCVPRSCKLSGSCESKAINFWPGTDASKWKLADGKVSVEDGDFRGKAGWFCVSPGLTATNRRGEFTIISTDIAAPELCVDNGSNTEIFVCSGWAELETLSEKFLVPPGGSVSHRQHWQIKSA